MKLNYVTLLLIFTSVNGFLEDFPMPHYGNALVRATIDIIEKFYLKRTSAMNFYHASMEGNDQNKETNLDTMNEIFYVLQSKIVVQLEGYLDMKETNRTRVYNIFFLDSYESFFNIFSLMSPSYFDYQGYYLIVLTTYSYQQYEIMLKMFEYLWPEYIVNVNVIWLAPQNANEAIMYTYFPYTNFYCGKAIPIQLNQFRFDQWLNKDLNFFPQKMSNLYGCPLTVATVVTPPFMILTQKEDGEILTDGIDGILVRVLSQRMNFTINLANLESQGSVYMNGTSTGALNMVIANEANLTIGYIASTATRNELMSSSYVYYTSNLIWITPPGRLFTSIEKLSKPFGIILWSCILIVLIVSFIAIRILRLQAPFVQNFVFGSRNTSPGLNILNIFFGGSLPRLPIGNFARNLVAMFMIYCLVIRSSYTGALFKFMRSESRESNADNINEMILRNYKFYILDSSREFVLSLSSVSERAVFIKRKYLPELQEKLLDADFKGVLLSSEEHTAFQNAIVSPEFYYNYASEIVSVFNLCIYMHRQSCLVEPINQNILKFLSNGLMETWVNGQVDKSYLKEPTSSGPRVLVNEHLIGAYELLAFGLLLSTLTFLFEVFSARLKIVKNFN